MSYFYLYNEDTSETLDFDTTLTELTFGGIKRNFSVEENVSSNGGIITGLGLFSSRKIGVRFNLKKTLGDNTYFATARATLLKWFAKNKNANVYLYVVTGDASLPKTLKTRVYPSDFGDEKIVNYTILEKTINLLCPSGYLTNTTATEYPISLSAESIYTLEVNNAGIIDVPFSISYTPSSVSSYLSCYDENNNGLELQGSLEGSVTHLLNTGDETLKIGNTFFDLVDYLTAGACFNLQPGTQNIYFYSATDADLTLSFYERFI